MDERNPPAWFKAFAAERRKQYEEERADKIKRLCVSTITYGLGAYRGERFHPEKGDPFYVVVYDAKFISEESRRPT